MPIINALRQFQVILRRQADADVPDPLLYLPCGAVPGFIAENRCGVPFARDKMLVPVLRDGLPQPLPAVQQVNLGAKHRVTLRTKKSSRALEEMVRDMEEKVKNRDVVKESKVSVEKEDAQKAVELALNA